MLSSGMAEVLRARFNSNPKPKIHKKPIVQKPAFTFCLDVVSNKPATTPTMSIKSSLKRAREPEQFYDEEASDVENENDDPALFSPKKSKNNSGRAIATPKSPRPARRPPTPQLAKVMQFTAQPAHDNAGASSIITTGLRNNNNRLKLRAKGAAKLPFSLHVALSNTANSDNTPPVISPTAPRSFWRLQADFKAIKKGTKFNIMPDDIVNAGARIIQHEASMMEIDPLNTAAYGIPLGLEHADHNKENAVPEFHLKNTTHLAANVIASARARHVRDVAKAGAKRAPLGDLEVEGFYAEGLTKSSAQNVESDESVANRVAGAKMTQHREAKKAAGSCGFTIAEVSDEE